ncbi:ATP-binding protein, partial [Ruminococcaceae bacterium OttesenSCG-928-L11]|nr:ATP-binding protein [Ruminococcaceae bacterium OttesenSCG-928-L11]
MGYPKQVHEAAWSKLTQRRDAARSRAVAHRQEIHKAIPEIALLERKMAATAAGITKAVIAAPAESEALIAKLGRENSALQREREALLTEAGYPADYLEEKFACSKCRDTGYVGVAMCSCLDTLLKAEALEFLSSGARGENCTFDAFRLDYYPDRPVEASGVVPRKRMGEIFQFCRQYAEHFTLGADSLLFLGQTGLGKTHLSLAIAQQVTELGFGVLYASAQQLMDRLEAERFSRQPDSRSSFNENMNVVLSSDLLILDDLGAEFTTSFTTSALYNIVNTRMLEHKPVIISSNLDLSAIEDRYGQRMASRLLCEYKVIKFFGKD